MNGASDGYINIQTTCSRARQSKLYRLLECQQLNQRLGEAQGAICSQIKRRDVG